MGDSNWLKLHNGENSVFTGNTPAFACSTRWVSHTHEIPEMHLALIHPQLYRGRARASAFFSLLFISFIATGVSEISQPIISLAVYICICARARRYKMAPRRRHVNRRNQEKLAHFRPKTFLHKLEMYMYITTLVHIVVIITSLVFVAILCQFK